MKKVEVIRDGKEIHSKSIAIINKSLLTEKRFPEINHQYKSNLILNIAKQ